MTYAIGTALTMHEKPARLGTIAPVTVTATVTSSRANVFGGISYIVKFELPKLMNGKPVTVLRSITDFELSQRDAKVIAKPRKARKPHVVKRTGNAAA